MKMTMNLQLLQKILTKKLKLQLISSVTFAAILTWKTKKLKPITKKINIKNVQSVILNQNVGQNTINTGQVQLDISFQENSLETWGIKCKKNQQFL